MTELAGLGASELLRLVRGGEVSALEITRAHLRRIEAADPPLHAFLRVNPEAESEARRIDASPPDARGPLAGIPVALKDNLCTKGLATTCGSRILETFVPTSDATVVAKLRSRGAVVLGKTNLDEFAMGSSTENSAFGPTRNPWDPARVPGGSSGGSAVAVATGMAPLALGSETGGSIRQPAALTGVVGLKPTYGRVSRLGLVAFGSSLDQVGPLAGSVADCALLLQAIAGPDPGDATSAADPVDDYGAGLVRGVRGLRVGLPKEYFGAGLDPEVGDAVRQAAFALEQEGAAVEEVSLPHTRFAIPVYYLVATAEASSNLARFDGVRYGLRRDPSRGLRAMYGATRGAGFGAEVKRRIMLGTFALSAGYYDAFYSRASRARTLLRRDFLDVFASGVDVLLTPTTPTAAFRVGEKADDPLAMYLSDVYTATINLAGIPALTVPVGLTRSRLPMGAQIVGPDFGEALLFRVGAAIERHCGRLRPPGPDERSETSASGARPATGS
jgi:aspartyl-tRNA(Asn)/glutamyl-tRNA(Gln) amidotransferase subunit A